MAHGLRAAPPLCAASALALALVAAPTNAEAAEPTSIVVYIEGQDADATRDEILAILPKSARVVDPESFTDALAKAGQRGPMGNVMAIAKQRGKLLEKIRKAIDAAGASAAIIGRIRKTRTLSREVYLLYVKGSGELAVDEPVPLDDSGEQRKGALKKTLDPALAEIASLDTSAAAPPPPDEGKPSEETPNEGGETDSGPGRTPHDVATAALIADVSFQVGGRFFEYSDGLTSNLRPYDVFGAPMGRMAIELYPLAFARDIPVGKDIGITASYAMAFGLTSATQGGEPISNTWMRVTAGLRGRIRLGDAPSAVLGINAGFGLLRFGYEAQGTLAAEVPDVDYKLLRFGLDGRIPLGPVALELEGTFLLPLSSGAVYDRQRDASVLGVEGRAGLAIPLSAGFELRVMGEYTRFFSAFAPVPGDAYVAGGALDQLITLRLGAAYAY